MACTYNISSVRKNAKGDYTVNFSSSFANTNYCVMTTSGNWNGRLASLYNDDSPFDAQSSLATNSVRVMICASTTGNEREDLNSIHVVVFAA